MLAKGRSARQRPNGQVLHDEFAIKLGIEFKHHSVAVDGSCSVGVREFGWGAKFNRQSFHFSVLFNIKSNLMIDFFKPKAIGAPTAASPPIDRSQLAEPMQRLLERKGIHDALRAARKRPLVF